MHMPRFRFVCFDLCFYMFVCSDLGFHMLVCLDLYSLYALHYLPCARVLCATFVHLDLGYVCHIMSCAIAALLSLYLSFLCFGLLVRTQSRPYSLFHRPYTLAHIKVFGSPCFACLCLLVPMLACSYALCLC